MMRFTIYFVTALSALFFAALPVHAQQLLISEDFQDQDLSQNPTWSGDLGDFSFFDDNGNILLRLDTEAEPSRSQIRTASQTAYGSWEFYYRQDFVASNTNRAFIFLTADRQDLNYLDGSGVNGYAIRTGENGDPKLFRLIRFNNGNQTEILASNTVVQSGTGYQIKVTRNEDNEWRIFVNEGYGSDPEDGDAVGPVVDATHTTSSYFGILARYTTANINAIFLDDIKITSTEAFELTAANVVNDQQITLQFNFQLDAEALQESQFTLSDVGNPDSVELVDGEPTRVRLLFDTSIPDGSYTLTASEGIRNVFGGELAEDVVVDLLVENPFALDQIAIITASQIRLTFTDVPMADRLIPENFSITDFEGSITSVTYDATENDKRVFITVNPSFDETDYTLVLSQIVSDAGWRLASGDSKEFTVANPFSVTSFDVISNTEFRAVFSQNPDPATIIPSNIVFTGDISPESAVIEDGNTVLMTFASDPGFGEYEIAFEHVMSQTGWPLRGETSFSFTLYDAYQQGDVYLSEFFYRTPTEWRTNEEDRPRYLEVRNRSERTFSLKNWSVNGTTLFASEHVALEPGAFLVITRGKSIFEQRFGSRNFVEADAMPVFSLTTSDNIIIRSSENIVVDSLRYTANIWGGNGRALERISAEIPAKFGDNWAESQDPLRGSPGLSNTVTQPTTPPTITAVDFPEPLTMDVTFSRTLSEESRAALQNFEFLPATAQITASRYRENARIIRFTLDANLEDGQEYQFRADAISDIFGNTVQEAAAYTFNFTNPFRISSVDITNGNTILVVFTQTLNVGTVALTDFELGDGTEPAAIEFPLSDRVSLTFPEDFSGGATVLKASGFSSMEGWQIESDTEITFFLYDDFELGDVLITEFMYQPPSGLSRYVEIRNTTDKYLNLRDWQLLRTDGGTALGGKITEQNLTLLPQSFMVLTSDSTSLFHRFGTRNYAIAGNFPGFTSSQPDQIRLKNAEGAIVDSLRYVPSEWGGNGVALERKSETAPSIFRDNWAPSTDPLLGTPGLANSVQAPETPPVFRFADFVDAETIEVRFSRAMNPETVIEPARFALEPGIDISSISIVTDSLVRITLAEPMISQQAYELTVSDLPDIFGNSITEASRTFTYYFFEEAATGDVVVTEFYHRPPLSLRANDARPQYVEIFNNSDKIINLKDWQLQRITGSAITVTNQRFPLLPQEYLVLTGDYSVFESIFGEFSVREMTNFPRFNLTTTDEIVIRNNQGQAIDSLRFVPASWSAEGVATERRSVDALSISLDNWALSAAEAGGTPGAENSIVAPSEFPEIAAVDFENATTISLRWPRDMATDAGDPDNYAISGDLHVTTAHIENRREVRLTLSANMSSGVLYTITANGMQDIFGNIAENEQTELRFWDIQPVAVGDVVISEFMYNPPSGYTNYIELYNRSEKALDISGWRQANDTGTRRVLTTTRHVLPPDSFIVILPNLNLLEIFPDINYVNAGSNLSALKNAADQIVITDANGVVLDSLRYESGWGGSGVALERRSADAISIFSENWAVSTSDLRGTPGRRNTVTAPQNAPQISRIDFVDDQRITLLFSKKIDPDEIGNAGRYAIDGGLEVTEVDVLARNEVRLQLNESMISGQTYQVSLNNLPDIFGNSSEQQAASFTYWFLEDAEPGDVVISEFMYRPPQGYTRYIELYNRSEKALNLAGWRQANDTGTRRVLTNSRHILPPDSFIVILPNENLLQEFPGINFINAGTNLSSLKVGGDDIVITNAAGVVLDSLRYSPSWGGNEVALERRSADAISIFNDNWGDSEDPKFGTPGRRNSVAIPDDAPEITTLDFVDGTTLRLSFSKKPDPQELTQESRYEISGGLVVSSVEKISVTEVALTLNQSMSSGELYTVTVREMPDIFGNRLAETQADVRYWFLEEAAPGDVVISEFLYNPPAGFTRYIELYNRSDKALNLAGWQQANDSGTRRVLTNSRHILPPDSFLVILPNENLLQEFPGINFINAGSNLSSLKINGDEIVITNAAGVVLDSLRYRPNWGGNQVALERRSADAPSVFSENWTDAQGPQIGTPGRANTATIPDQIPRITAADFISATEVFVHFDAVIDTSQIRNPSRYQLQNGPAVSFVEVSSPREVILHLTEPMISKQEYTVVVTDLPDIFGNTISSAQTSFTYYFFEQAEAGDVVVNEFYHRPPVDLRANDARPQYIELFNNSDKVINLKDWRLQRITGSAVTVTGQRVPLLPQQYVVLTGDYLVFESIFGEFSALEMANFPRFNLTTTDEIVIRNNQGQAIDSVRFVPASWSAEGVATERRSADALSTAITNWALSEASLGGTPGLANSVTVQDQNPEIIRAEFLSADSIHVVFSTDMFVETAENAEFYTLSPQIPVSEVRFVSLRDAYVVLDGTMTSGTLYQITVTSVTDIFGNEIQDGQAAFRYWDIQPVAPGDVVINEFMYNVADGFSRYVELYNRSDKPLDISGWQKSNDTGTRRVLTNLRTIIPPDSFLVLLPDATLLEKFPDINAINVGSAFAALKTGGDEIVITDAQGVVLDSLRYAPDWGGTRVALERKSAEAGAVFRDNWANSEDETLGTPGRRNSILPPDDAPHITDLFFVTADSIHVRFNRALDRNSSLQIANYSLSGIGLSSLQLTGTRELAFGLSEAMESLQSYAFTANNVRDIFGNVRESETRELTYYAFEIPAKNDIVINEFYHRPPAAIRPEGRRPQYIEIFNRSDKLLNLAGWRIERSGGTGAIISPSAKPLLPGEKIAITGDISVFEEIYPDGRFAQVSGFPQYNLTTADVILLRKPNGQVSDSLRFEPATWSREGRATERKSAEVTSVTVDNWAIAPDTLTGTPGLPNIAQPPADPPQMILVDYLSADSLLVRFNRAIDTTLVANPERFELVAGPSVSQVAFSDFRNAVLVLEEEMVSGTFYTLQATDFADIFGNIRNSSSLGFTYYDIQPAEPGDVVISEFMYNEPDGYSRYIELYNRSDKAISIAGWMQANDTGTRRVLTTERHVIPPDSFIVIVPDVSLLEIFPDINVVNAGSSLSALKNGGDEIVITDAQGVVMDSLRYHPDWGGDKIALERIFADVPAIFRENWRNSTAQGLGTPGRRNTAQPDQNIPKVTLVEFLAPDSLAVRFNRNMNASVISDPATYTLIAMANTMAKTTDVRGNARSVALDARVAHHPASASLTSGSIAEVRFIDHRNVILVPATPMQNGFSYRLEIPSLPDIIGNAGEAGEIPFVFYNLRDAQPGEVVINEFMFRPPSGLTRYIELKNTTQDAITLKNWTINNDTGARRTITTDRLIIPPDSFIVLLPSPDLLEVFPHINAVVVPSMPAQKTSADDIVIRNSAGLTLDSLSYTSGWGGNGVSLERRSTSVPAIFRDNWANSPADEFGTPGAPNLVPADTEIPVVTAINVESATRLRVVFSKVMDEQRARTTQNYTVSDGVSVTAITWNQNQVFVTLSPALQAGITYDVSIQNLTDIFGNELEPVTETIQLLTFDTAQERDIVINEILYRGLEGEISRFVELYNRSNKTLNLDQWFIGRGTGSPVRLLREENPGDVTLPIVMQPGQYLVLTGNTDWVPQHVRALRVANFPALSSLGDAVFIRDADGQRIDSLRYSTSWGGNEPGVSLERKDPNGASNDPTNWRSSPQNVSPGAQNPAFSPIEDAPELRFAGLTSSGQIKVITNRHVVLTPDTRFRLGQSQLNVARYDAFRADEIRLTFNGQLQPDSDELLVVENLEDFAGNRAETRSQPIARPIAPGDVVFNEILYQPLAATADRAAQSEFLEFFNTRDYAISLEGFYIHDRPNPDGGITRITPVQTRGAWIPAGGYFLLHGDTESEFENSRLARFFGLTDARFVARANRTSLSLTTAGKDVYLADSTGTTIDFVSYRPEWHNPNRVDVRGVSLERINPFGPSNDASNWSSSTRANGATPGVQNTIFAVPSDFSERSGVVMEPNPFAPDGSGDRDNLFINYTLDEPDFLMRVRIYDRYGRLVRTLADGQVAGLQGTLTWDGLRDDGSENRMGIYIVVFEAYNSASGRNRTFKETVVLARRL